MFNSDQFQKLELIDTIFESLNIEELRKIAESELIVGKLKGVAPSTPLKDLYFQHAELQNRVSSLEAQLSSLQYDFQLLTKTVLKPYDYSSQSDVQTLKSKYNIYT